MIETVLVVLKKIEKAGFEAYIVGGTVRDLLMGKIPSDIDLTSSAKPEEILALFPEAKYENDFGTVILAHKDETGKVLAVFEITTYRSEGQYRDHRRPDELKFEEDLDLDLRRRDFTVNAMALGLTKRSKYSSQELKFDWGTMELVDLFGGLKDIKLKVIRAVGEPLDRFKEDALRMMRAIRFSSQLAFSLEPKTERAILRMAGSLKFISAERVRDELIKIL
ncbi:MAG TPA: hypothetical protein VJZ99_02845, partial [Patescibacteria group bacterium]|nr:hypothetical protein [Patescibacteria group bacterium]